MLCTRSGFEREATSNSEMVYFPSLVEQKIQSELTVQKAENRIFVSLLLSPTPTHLAQSFCFKTM